MATKTFAVWQQNAAVFGTGSTEDIALAEARSYAPDCEPERYVGQALVSGAFYSAPCSDALAKHVAAHGGDVRVAVEGKTLKLASEVEGA